MKKTVALLLALACLCSVSTALCARDAPIGYYIRFIPTTITVGSDTIKVVGYFVNLNTDVAVKNFKEFEMSVYENNKLVAKGDFGTINQFTVEPLGLWKQSFTFNGKHSMKTGTYACDEKYSCTFSCKFSYVER
ncbi:MAG: hypothetical protein IK099_16100 [Clostridia bacterium]|nr:hypothetical protein [Clostridia bacterium]